MSKEYRLSITLGDKSYVCNNINDEDIIIKEFKHYDEAENYINNNFKKIKDGNNYNYYVKQKENNEWTKQDTYSIKERTKVG